MAFSCACVDFLHLSLSGSDRYTGIMYDGSYRVRRVCSLGERLRISRSVDDCQLCQKIYAFLKDIYRDHYYRPITEDGPVIEAWMISNSLLRERNLVSSIHLTYDKKTWWRDQGDRPREDLYLDVWADQGTPASMEFVDWQPIVRGDHKEAAGHAWRILNGCLSHHADCRLHEPAEQFKLPSRVLYIEDSEESGKVSVKLIESGSSNGKYCALSHCWGPKDKQPLRTTQRNIADHLSSIPWNNLPPLFQDAITLTKDIGIKYLWIDSLCIVQDDNYDWLNESKSMSTVYRGATLVIAAVDSKDSTERLSKAKRPEMLTVRAPYYAQDGSMQGSYNIRHSTSSTIYGPIIDGPLRERGWAFQEFYLGRRKIFFTSEGIGWQCCRLDLSERGGSADLRLYETLSWLYCLEQYSGKHLTYPSDRITALLGIVAEMGKSRKDSFLPELGIWEDRIVQQLLWRPVAILTEDRPDLPTWSWASTSGKKLWLFSSIDDPQEAVIQGFTQTVELKHSEFLDASGLLISAKINPAPLQQCCLESLHTISTSYSPILPHYLPDQHDFKRFIIVSQNGGREPIGLGMFDGPAVCSECFCFVLASSGMTSDNQCFPDAEEASTGGKKIGDENIEEGRQFCGHGSTHDIAKLGQLTESHWALLLQPIDGTLDTFKRVGMGWISPPSVALEAQEGEVKRFKIV